MRAEVGRGEEAARCLRVEESQKMLTSRSESYSFYYWTKTYCRARRAGALMHELSSTVLPSILVVGVNSVVGRSTASGFVIGVQ